MKYPGFCCMSVQPSFTSSHKPQYDTLRTEDGDYYDIPMLVFSQNY